MTTETINRVGLTPYAIRAFVVMALFFVGGGWWAGFAELESAALAPGKVSVESNRKTIQHFEGGIVKAIHVKEGERVRAGQILVTLDDKAVRSDIRRITLSLQSQLALKARLAAERDLLTELKFPQELISARENAGVRGLLRNQQEVFAANTAAREGQVKILNQQILQRDEEVGGLKGVISAAKRQIFFLDSEIEDKTKLLAKGLVDRPRVNRLKRERAELNGQVAQSVASIARVHQAIGEARIKIAEIQTRTISKSVETLQNVELQILDLRQQLEARRNVLARATITAPQSGRVVGLRVHTDGGVISAGEAVMDLVPQEEKLLIDARISPADIDVVAEGQTAEIRLSAYRQRHVKPLKGKLLSVSADAFTSPETGASYYLGRIEITEPVGDKIPEGRLYPGMLAETVILTGKSTLLEWLLDPINRTFEKGMREQ